MLKVSILILSTALVITIQLNAQPIKTLNEYLPTEITYNPDIPTPQSVLGFEVGEWHVRPDLLVAYMYTLAEASDRITIQEYARTHEKRPLVLLTITSPKNHRNIEAIKSEREKLQNPQQSFSIDINTMPSVVWMGYSVHGNEPSGSNASLLVAYYLAAGQSTQLDELLTNTVILLDPNFNPDGLARFAHWANTNKSTHTLIADPNEREHNEYWPGGRTNHYWFDLNRDWLPLAHPESKGRIAKFQEWLPNILTDHHEMGTNSTFFFQPGIPSRTNPITPQENQDLTAEIASYHADIFNKNNTLYYSEESFDDYYYGKGSTYPDVNGSIGILFEQASSRGHIQESIHGDLSFSQTIQNQFNASLSTLKATQKMRVKLNDYQRRFYKDALALGEKSTVKGFIFGSDKDRMKTWHFLDLLTRHNIDVFENSSSITANGRSFEAGKSYIIPTEQPKYRLIRALFDTPNQFKDSLFYDVSAFTMPYAYNLDYAELNSKQFKTIKMGDKIDAKPKMPKGTLFGGSHTYAYLFEVNEYYAHRAIYRLQSIGARLKVAQEPFTIQTENGLKHFNYGTILIAIGTQPKGLEDQIHEVIQTITEQDAIDIYSVNTGLTPSGIDLGSGTFSNLDMPKAMILTGFSVSSSEVGETWHLLDTRFKMPLIKLEDTNFNRVDLSRYNVIIFAGGSYRNLDDKSISTLKEWVKNGGILIGYKSATNWLKRNELLNAEFVDNDDKGKKENQQDRYPYNTQRNRSGAQVIGGAIFETNVDLTHPLLYGYSNNKLPVFRNSTTFFKQRSNPYSNPVIYSENPLLSGYISAPNLKKIKGSAAVMVQTHGSGRVIAMTDNPNFRAFWWGTNKLFLNAVFFGQTISASTAN